MMCCAKAVARVKHELNIHGLDGLPAEWSISNRHVFCVHALSGCEGTVLQTLHATENMLITYAPVRGETFTNL